MSKHVDVDWDAMERQSAPALIDSKRAIEQADRERAGYDPDWRLRLVMLREAREEAESERKREVANRPEIRAARSAHMRAAWQAGKFSGRKQAYLKKTDRLVARALRLREDSCTYAQIADALDITAYTAWRWCGAERKPEPTNRVPVTVDGVSYPSLREAERATGISRWLLAKRRNK